MLPNTEMLQILAQVNLKKPYPYPHLNKKRLRIFWSLVYLDLEASARNTEATPYCTQILHFIKS